jgi:AcrR family transcriptional regulator
MAKAEQHDSAGMPRPMRADARRNYDRLVATAREAFAEYGPEAPLDVIARRTGVGPGTLYRHFPSRESLLEAAYRGEVAELSARARTLLDDHPPAEALRLWMREQVSFVVHKRGLAMTLKAAIDKDSETFAWCKKTLGDAADVLLARAQEAGEIRADIKATDLLRLAHGVGIAVENAPDDADRFLTMLLDGLRARD